MHCKVQEKSEISCKGWCECRFPFISLSTTCDLTLLWSCLSVWHNCTQWHNQSLLQQLGTCTLADTEAWEVVNFLSFLMRCRCQTSRQRWFGEKLFSIFLYRLSKAAQLIMYLFCIALQLYFGLKTEQDDSSLVLGISTQPTPEHFLASLLF